MKPEFLSPGDIIGYEGSRWRASVQGHFDDADGRGATLLVISSTDGMKMKSIVKYNYLDFSAGFYIIESAEPMTPCVSPLTHYYLRTKEKE